MAISKDEKRRLAEEASKQAFADEINYGCCPQCVLKAVQSTVGYVTDETIKASHGLSGGGGLMGQGACGALTGGLLALGAKRGRDHDKFDKGKFIGNFRLGQELTQRFVEEFGGVTCKELQEKFTGKTYDFWDESQYKAFTDARGDKCAIATATVTKWVVEMM
ncbi:MAG: C-GCAxxG-C-C family protein [Gammaproteobacteria bacterium]|nr:C-GCAxxG-C-C family protein [Gammaproteobacteria bacterium]MDH5650332.1 C-GCAxxG-C-C family protein [Gammaproteobacteria bacterium]